METVPCNLCGSRDCAQLLVGRDRVFGLGDTFRLVKCRCCGLARLNPRPDAKELEAYYPFEYYSLFCDYPRNPSRLTKVGLNMVLQRRIPQFVPGARALEIGCAGGAYLVELHKLGWEVHGIEIASAAAQHARNQFGLDVRTGAAEDALAQFPDASFDLVAMWHVLEHLFDPSGVLAEVHRVLKPGGKLMLEVPNFSSLSRFILRTYWFPLELPRHLYHFTVHTLTAVLVKAGFRGTRVKGVPAAAVVTASLQLLWNRWIGDLKGTAIALNPALLCLFFPVSWLLARFLLSSVMIAEATKPTCQQPAGTTSSTG